MTLRRELVAAVALSLAGAALGLLAASQPWAHVTVAPPKPLPTVQAALSGRDLAPAAAALSLVGLAGVVALAATRRLGRVVVGLILLLGGVGMLVTSHVSTAGVAGSSALADAVPGATLHAATLHIRPTAWWVPSIAGGALLVAAGALTAVRGRRWRALSARYERQPRQALARPEAAAALDEAGTWTSLDRGIDPTADQVADPAGEPTGDPGPPGTSGSAPPIP